MTEANWKRRQREQEERAAKRRSRLVTAYVIILLLAVALVPVSIAASIAAPCKYIDWLPVSDLPGRCLPGGSG